MQIPFLLGHCKTMRGTTSKACQPDSSSQSRQVARKSLHRATLRIREELDLDSPFNSNCHQHICCLVTGSPTHASSFLLAFKTLPFVVDGINIFASGGRHVNCVPP